MIRLLSGDARDVLPTLPAESVQCVVTSPPYYALRSYLDAAHPDKHREIGSEATPDEYLATMVGVFREVRRVMRPDAVAFINMGDAYRDKQLLLMPARLALALQADGWWVRSDIIWHKPNPMPESVTDRCVSAHEHVFMLTRSARYFYDAAAIAEAAAQPFGVPRLTGQHKADADGFTTNGHSNSGLGSNQGAATRACRNVWTIATHAYPDAHFATFPPELAERCIKAGTRPGDTVLDPFAGAGTTLLVADRLQRDAVGIELNTAYTEMAMERCRADAPLFTAFPPAEDPEESRMADLFTDMAAD